MEMESKKKTRKTFYKKLKTFQVLRLSIPFNIWGTFPSKNAILWSIKTIKLTFFRFACD